MRKSARDGSFTPTEQRKRDALMRQFLKFESGSGIGNTEAYRSAQCWDAKGRLKP